MASFIYICESGHFNLFNDVCIIQLSPFTMCHVSFLF